MSNRKVQLTPSQARAIFDSLQLAQCFVDQRIEAHQASGNRTLEKLGWERLRRIQEAFNTLGVELQDIAEPTFHQG